MVQSKTSNPDSFATNPSKITEHLVNIVLKLNEKHESDFKEKNPLKKFANELKINLYLKEGYKDFYEFLKSYKIPYNISAEKNSIKKLALLFEEFEYIYDRIMLNNFALAYAYAKNKDKNKQITNPVLTIEDKKNLMLKKLAKKQITPKQFKEQFGHYALNAYELSSKRFEEYSDKELLKIAKLAENLEIKKEKVELEECLKQNQKQKEIIPILIALRELAKYDTLFIVREIRRELLKIQKEKRIKNIFSYSFGNIVTIG